MKSINLFKTLVLTLIGTFVLSCDKQENVIINDDVQDIIAEAQRCGKLHNEGLSMVYSNLLEKKNSSNELTWKDFQTVTLNTIQDFSIQNNLPLESDESIQLFAPLLSGLRPVDDSATGRVLNGENTVTTESVFENDVNDNLTVGQKDFLDRIFLAGFESIDADEFKTNTDEIINDALGSLTTDELPVVLEAAYIGQSSAEYWDENLAVWHELVGDMTIEDLLGSSNGRAASPPDLTPDLNTYDVIYDMELYHQLADQYWLNGVGTVLTYDQMSRRKAIGVGIMDLGTGILGGIIGLGAPGAIVAGVTGSALMGLAFAIGC